MSEFSDFVADPDRQARTGLDEAVFCASKTPEQIAAIIKYFVANKKRTLLTRLTSESLSALPPELRSRLTYDELSRTAELGSDGIAIEQRTGLVAVVSAGTSDSRVAAEAARTLAYYGYSAELHQDVGVAGLWRVLSRLDSLKALPVIIVVAGMDAALPTVLAGLVPSAIIAVPTSVGYGVATGGKVALAAMLSSCVPGVTVVNIDNGYGAACAAVRMLRFTGINLL